MMREDAIQLDGFGEDLGLAGGDFTLFYALAGLGVLAYLFWPRG